MTYTSASLFSGGGLWDVGAKAASFVPVWGIEIRPDIATVAERNIPDFYVVRADVATVDYSALPRVKHLHASPSCKNASDANAKGEESPEDMQSAEAICRAIRAQKPQAFTLENVWQYRRFESFKMILACLEEFGYHFDYWHLNSADYGVPQTRKRLILIARLDRKPAKPMQTHYKPDAKKAVKGMQSMFWEPWGGWYQAIEDLIPGLPKTQPAPWQMARMPEEYKSMLLAQGSYDGEVVNRGEDEPAFTITANSNQGGLKAFLINKSADKFGDGIRDDSEPGFTVMSNSRGRYRAFIVDGQGAGKPSGLPNSREATEPMFTVTDQGKGASRAFVVGSQYAQPNTVKDRSPQVRRGDEPYFTVTVSGGSHSDQRIYAGHWVSITPRCLARFQSVPDEYELPEANGLACEVVGNGVPSLLAQRICESLL